MATIRIILDERRPKHDSTFPLKLRITHLRKTRHFSLEKSLLKSDWDFVKQQVKKANPYHSQLNKLIRMHKLKAENFVLKLDFDNEEYTVDHILAHLNGIEPAKEEEEEIPKIETVFEYGDKIVNRLKVAGKLGNARAYEYTLKRLESHLGHKDLAFTDITYEWLEDFEADFLGQTVSINTISFYLRTLRAIYNRAMKAKIVDRNLYPFHDYSIKKEKTAKRAIAKEKIKMIENVVLEPDTAIWHNRNFFILSFNLIGISFVDLAYLKWENIKDGRLRYVRRKTKKRYNIKLTPKATEIIEYYRGYRKDCKYVLPVIADDAIDDLEREQFYTRQGYKLCNKYLKRIRKELKIEDKVTTYVARHSWATTARKLGYAKDLIAEALGHEYGNKVTGIYLDNYDLEVIDEMNAKVCE